jgi:surface antigen
VEVSGRLAAAGAAAMLAACAGTQQAGPAATAADAPAVVVQYVLESRPSGEVVSWQAKGAAQRGTVTALRTFRGPDGYCRDYALTVSDDDGAGAAWQETACRDGLGEWHPAQLAAP